MPTVKEVLSEKGSQVLSIRRDSTVIEAAALMNEHRTGSVLVVTDDHIDGIFTERDVLSRVVGERRDPGATRVEEVMTTELTCCEPETPIEEARAAMKNRRIRHRPVVDQQQRVYGIISIGDLNAYHLEGQEQMIYFLREYLYGGR